MGRVVIACYRPKPGMTERLIELTKIHVSRLRAEQLVTDRAPIVAQAADGTVVEVFEWKSKEAIEAAHSNSAVQKLWQEYSQVCDYVPISSVPEAGELFSEFEPIDL